MVRLHSGNFMNHDCTELFFLTLKSSGGSRGGAWPLRVPPLFFEKNEARRAEKIFFGDRAPPPPPSEGLDPPLYKGNPEV